MTKVKSNLQSYVEQFVAFVKGDDSAVKAEKVYRLRQSALNTHYHNAQGQLVRFEQDLEDAELVLKKRRFNDGKLIKDMDAYVKGLVDANNSVDEAKEKLEEHNALIKFLDNEREMGAFEL